MSQETTDSQAPENAATVSPEAIKAGRQQYMVCGACHGQKGEGTAAAPPLAGSEWVNGPAENLIRIQLRGLAGPITVKGQEYNYPAGMQAMAYQTDEQIANVLTYVRGNFGNDAPPVGAEEVAAFRDEVGKPQLVVADLIPPLPAAPLPDGTTNEESGTPAPVPAKYANLDTPIGLPFWLIAAIFFFTLFCFAAVFRKA